MSTSVVFHISVRTSASALATKLEAEFTAFLRANGLSNELSVARFEADGTVALCASSPWAIAISRASDWVPDVEAQFERAMRALDPACIASFRTRYPDDYEDTLLDRLEATDDGDVDRVQVFFHFDGEDDHVPGDAPRPIPRSNVWQLGARLFLSGDFFGLIDEAGQTLQAIVGPDGRVWLDLPAPAEGGSYGRFIEPRDLHALLRALPTAFTRATVPGLDFTD